MKKIILMIMVLAMILSCAACSSGSSSTADAKESGAAGQPGQTQGAEPGTQDTKEPDGEIKLSGVAHVVGRSITVNYNTDRRYDTKANSIVFNVQLSDSIALTYDKGSSYTGPVDGVFDLLNDGDLFKDISLYTGTAFDGNTVFLIDTVSSEKVTVAGFESVRIIGTVTDAKGKAAAVYAYTFVIDETPCMLAGVVIDDANHPDIANAVKEEVDMMAQTIKEA